jgi:thymidylate synthase
MNIPIKCILAVDVNSGIATQNGIPWKIKEDLKMFQEITTTCKGKGAINAVIMGRKTYESIGKVLKGRLNVVITSSEQPNENIVDIETPLYFKTQYSAIAWLYQQKTYYVESIFIIGGQQLYDWCISNVMCDEIYITQIKSDYKTTLFVDTDILFYEYDVVHKECKNVTDYNDPEKGSIEIEFLKYEKSTKICKNQEEQNYLNMMKNIIKNGNLRPTRNANTFALFGKSLEFDLKNGFPLLTTKKMFLRGVFEELKFFALGKTNTKELEEKGVNIWKGNTSREFLDKNGHPNYQEGDMGPMYGFQLSHFGAEYKGCDYNYESEGYNQLEDVINLLKTDKFSRRILMTTYNPSQSKEGVLYPCHGLTIQFAVEGKQSNELVCSMYQRSADFFLGIPFNIASYALLVHIICNIINNNVEKENQLIPGRLVMFMGDVHVYEGHLEAVYSQLNNLPNRFPWLYINKQLSNFKDIENLEFTDLELIGYNSYQSIKAEMYA